MSLTERMGRNRHVRRYDCARVLPLDLRIRFTKATRTNACAGETAQKEGALR
jgi:hypothetical protein